MDFDSAGWALGRISPLEVNESFSLLSPEIDGWIDEARWAHQASTFFRASLAVVQKKRYPAGTAPIADAVEVDVAPKSAAAMTRVLIVTTPIDRATAVRDAVLASVLLAPIVRRTRSRSSG